MQHAPSFRAARSTHLRERRQRRRGASREARDLRRLAERAAVDLVEQRREPRLVEPADERGNPKRSLESRFREEEGRFRGGCAA